MGSTGWEGKVPEISSPTENNSFLPILSGELKLLSVECTHPAGICLENSRGIPIE